MTLDNTLVQEVTLVKFLMDKESYEVYYKYIQPLNLEREIKMLVESIAGYYTEYPDKTKISQEELILYNAIKNPLTKTKEVYSTIFEKILTTELNEDLIKDNFNYILEQYYGSEILFTVSEAIEDCKQNFIDEVQETIDKYNSIKVISAQNSDDSSVFVTHDIATLIRKRKETKGLSWRLSSLRTHLGDLHGKSLGHVFARVDTGKTSFILSELAHWTPQLEDDEYLLHCNNEEDGEKIMPRYAQALLGVTKEQLEENPEKCQAEFNKRHGDRLLLYDNAIITIEQIEQFLIKYNVRLVVVDQADKLHFIGNKTLSDVGRLQTIYAKLRELSKKYGCDILTVGQASQSADNKKWLQTTDLDGSKTLKPGEFDYIIGIGRVLDNTGTKLESLRYLNLCKNKMGTGQHAQQEVFIDTRRALYYDTLLVRGEEGGDADGTTTTGQGGTAQMGAKGTPIFFGDLNPSLPLL